MSITTLAIASFFSGILFLFLIQYTATKYDKYLKMKEKYNDYERKANACTHGYEDWDDCPTCRH